MNTTTDLKDAAPLLTKIFDKLATVDEQDKASCISTVLGKALAKTQT